MRTLRSAFEGDVLLGLCFALTRCCHSSVWLSRHSQWWSIASVEYIGCRLSRALFYCPPALGTCLSQRYPLTSVAATRLSQLMLEIYFTRGNPWYYLFTIDSCPVVSVPANPRLDRIGMVLGGAFTYTQTINLHFVHTEYVRDLVRLLWSYVGMNVTQLCLFGIDCTSAILWSPSQLGGREWIYTTTTAGIRNVQAVRVYIEVSTQQCLRKLDA